MNSTYGITPENLMTHLPSALAKDKDMAALAQGAADVLSQRPTEINEASIYTRIDKLPEGLLDLLAHDFKVDWWDPDYTLEEKLVALKDSWYVHKHMGTKAAVETAISAIYPGTKVVEWFEYGGRPYCFKLLIDVIHVDSEKHKRVLERVDYYKNLRSHLDGVEYVARPEGVCTSYSGIATAGIGMTVGTEVKVYGLG